MHRVTPRRKGAHHDQGKGKAELIDVKELLERGRDFLRVALQALLQAALEAEMTDAIGPRKGSAPRRGWPIAAAIIRAPG